MGWTVRGSNPGGGEIFRICPDRSWGPASLLYNGYRFFPGGKERPGRDADPNPFLVPWSRKSRAIPLLPLWAVRPVQSLSACTRVHFTFIFMWKMQALCDLAPCLLVINSRTSVMERHEDGRSTILRKICECRLNDVPHISEEFNFSRERWEKLHMMYDRMSRSCPTFCSPDKHRTEDFKRRNNQILCGLVLESNRTAEVQCKGELCEF